MIYFFLPETAGLSLEALDCIFDHDGITRGVLDKKNRRNMLEVSRKQQSTNMIEQEEKPQVDAKEFA
jgi:hypothetical protein